jgi:cytochrome bd ubiquinol oxidase subunit II
MLTTIIIILAVSFMLYAILGGADYGAGIIEMFAGRKGEKIISKAIAPVWEANHVWLILAIVIIFTGFPLVYSTISTALHIPLMIVLIGIICRGTTFTFRHYDVENDGTHKYYTLLFRISSLLTPIFLGVTLGAMILGKIDVDAQGSFYEAYISPWLNAFCFTVGFFCTSLFGYIAAIFLLGEVEWIGDRKRYVQLSKAFLLTTITLGVMVFVMAQAYGHNLFTEFFRSPISIAALSSVLLLIPVIFYLLNHPNIIYLRIVAGIQVSLIMIGWFAIQFPILIYEKNGDHLTFYNTQAPYATLFQLLVALFVGLVLVIPAFYFLFKVFKGARDN